MSGPLLGHGASVALAGAANIEYVGSTYIGLTNIRIPSWQPNRGRTVMPRQRGGDGSRSDSASLATATTTASA